MNKCAYPRLQTSSWWTSENRTKSVSTQYQYHIRHSHSQIPKHQNNRNMLLASVDEINTWPLDFFPHIFWTARWPRPMWFTVILTKCYLLTMRVMPNTQIEPLPVPPYGCFAQVSFTWELVLWECKHFILNCSHSFLALDV